MGDPIDLPMNSHERLAEPPLLDSLHYEREADGFSITFVPSAGDDTQCVFMPRDSVEGRLVAAYLYRIQQLMGQRIERVVHRGGGDYSMRIPDGSTIQLSDEGATENWAPEVFDRLKQIAEAAEAWSKLPLAPAGKSMTPPAA